MNTEEAILEIRLAVKKNGQYTVGKMMLMYIPHKEELKHFIKGLEEFATMSYFNGWFVRDDGDCECLYCGKIVKGFDFGKYNKVTKIFNPKIIPCSCRPL